MPELYGFQRAPARTLQRIADTNGSVGRFRQTVPSMEWPAESVPLQCMAKATTDITAATESGGTRTVGSGSANIYYLNGSDELTIAQDDDSVNISVTVKNSTMREIYSGTFFRLWQSTVDGVLYVDEKFPLRIGKTGGDVTNGATASVTIWSQSGDSAPSATSETVTAINGTAGQTMKASKFLMLADIDQWNRPNIEPVELKLC